jgi:hypothetical protein
VDDSHEFGSVRTSVLNHILLIFSIYTQYWLYRAIFIITGYRVATVLKFSLDFLAIFVKDFLGAGTARTRVQVPTHLQALRQQQASLQETLQ